MDANGNDAFDFGEPQPRPTRPATTRFPACSRARSLSARRCRRALGTARGRHKPRRLRALGHAVSGRSSTGQSFGFTRYASVSGSKFDDTSNNGVKDGWRSAAAGSIFYVDYDNDDVLDAGEPPATSAATTGAWTITGVKAGSLPVREVPRAVRPAPQPATTCRYDLTSPRTAAAPATSSATTSSALGVGHGLPDNDADGARARGRRDTGLAGWTRLRRRDNNGTHDTGESRLDVPTRTASTSSPACQRHYRPSGSRPQSGLDLRISRAAAEHRFGSATAEPTTGKDFGVWGPASISGNVFEDAGRRRRRQGGGRVGRSRRAHGLRRLGQRQHARRGRDRRRRRPPSGDYSITGMHPGHVHRAAGSAGRLDVLPPSPCSYAVTISGDERERPDFGSYTTGSVAGNVYEDAQRRRREGRGRGRNLVGPHRLPGPRRQRHEGRGRAGDDDGCVGQLRVRALSPGATSVRLVVPGGWTARSRAACTYAVTVTTPVVRDRARLRPLHHRLDHRHGLRGQPTSTAPPRRRRARPRERDRLHRRRRRRHARRRRDADDDERQRRLHLQRRGAGHLRRPAGAQGRLDVPIPDWLPSRGHGRCRRRRRAATTSARTWVRRFPAPCSRTSTPTMRPAKPARASSAASASTSTATSTACATPMSPPR